MNSGFKAVAMPPISTTISREDLNEGTKKDKAIHLCRSAEKCAVIGEDGLGASYCQSMEGRIETPEDLSVLGRKGIAREALLLREPRIRSLCERTQRKARSPMASAEKECKKACVSRSNQ